MSRAPTLAEVVAVTAVVTEVPAEVILNPSYQMPEVADARHIAQYLCRRMGFMTTTRIQKGFKQKSHRSVIYACTKVEEWMLRDEKAARTVATIKERLKKLAEKEVA